MARRQERGSSLVELLVAITVGAVLSVAALCPLLACMRTADATAQRSQLNESLGRALERMGSHIRAANTLGHRYRPAQQPAPLWNCSNNMLVLQKPLYDDQGFALSTIQKDAVSGEEIKIPTVDTEIYRVVPDAATKEPTYKLTVERIFGDKPGRTGKLPVGEQTLLTNIVGPVDAATGEPKVFQYVDKTDTATARDTIVMESADNFDLVVVNLEIKNSEKGGPATLGLKSEFYLRNSGR